MNFVKQVEEQLRDLGTESRRKHPGVKEAAERAILSLRTLQNKYVVAVRAASRASSSPLNANANANANADVANKHPTTAIFQSQDVLRPFLLAANYPDVGYKLLNLSLDGMQALLTGDAVCKNDGINVVRVLSIQANVCAAAILSKSGGGGTMGSMMVGIGMPSAGSVVNAGVGTISSLGNSIWSGFGFKSQGVGGGGGGGQGDDYSANSSGTTTSNTSGTASASASASSTAPRHSHVACTVHTSNRSLKEDEAISIRILQTISMIVNGLELSEEVLSQCIYICLVLAGTSDSSGGGGGGRTKLKRMDSGMTAGGGGGGGIVSGGQGSVKKVSGAATATMRQIISTLFARAAAAHSNSDVTSASSSSVATDGENENDNEEKGNDAYSQMLASKTLLDLCNLAECKETGGPFGQALIGQQQRIHPPSQSFCFDLIEIILEQQVELFTVAPMPGDDATSTWNFFSILKDGICPLVTRLLEECGTVGMDKNEDGCSLTLILKLTSLASSIVNRYGDKDSLQLECCKLLRSMARLIKSATDLLRDSHEFEVRM